MFAGEIHVLNEEIIKTTYAVPWLIYSKIQYSRETVNPNTQEKQNYSIGFHIITIIIALKFTAKIQIIYER